MVCEGADDAGGHAAEALRRRKAACPRWRGLAAFYRGSSLHAATAHVPDWWLLNARQPSFHVPSASTELRLANPLIGHPGRLCLGRYVEEDADNAGGHIEGALQRRRAAYLGC